MPGPPPPGWGDAPPTDPSGGGAGAPPGWGSAPPAAASPQPGGWQMRGANIKGMQFENTNAVTPPELSKLHSEAMLTEELSTMLNQYKQALDQDAMRRNKTSDVDKAITLETQAPLWKTAGESLQNYWDLWKYDPQIYGHKLHMGLGSDRPGVIFLSARLRSRLAPLTAKDTSIRAYRMIENVQEHFPYASDSLKESYDKLRMWQQTVNDARDELIERGIRVPGGQPVMAPPQNVTPETSGRPVGAASPPPFTPTRSVGDRLENKRMQDDKGNWWYYDIEDGKWQKYGG